MATQTQEPIRKQPDYGDYTADSDIQDAVGQQESEKETAKAYARARRRNAVDDFLETAAKTAVLGPAPAIAKAVKKKFARDMGKNAMRTISDTAIENASEPRGGMFARVRKTGPYEEVAEERYERLKPSSEKEALGGSSREAQVSRNAAEWITSTPEQRKKIDGIGIFNRIDDMSDEEFDRAVKSGELTPEQIHAAGDYFKDVWIGDVWREGDHDDEPDPTYEEFYADPSKYGHGEDSFGNHLERYRDR